MSASGQDVRVRPTERFIKRVCSEGGLAESEYFAKIIHVARGDKQLAHRVPITVRLDSFEGPLDLLLYLIQTHEMDISKVSISLITDQYLTYVRLMQELNFDTASEFLVMAATLVQWKSKALLPDEKNPDGTAQASEDGELTQEELIRQLLEHQRFREAGETLGTLPLLGDDVFTRPNRRPPIEKVWKEMNVTQIATGYQDMLVRMRKRTTVLKKETVSLADKIHEFSGLLKVGAMTELTRLLSAQPERGEIVVTFLASLELSRLKKMRLHQEKAYSEIYVELVETLKNFNFELASGFEAEVQSGARDAAAARDEARVEAAASAAGALVGSGNDLHVFGNDLSGA